MIQLPKLYHVTPKPRVEFKIMTKIMERVCKKV